MPPANQLTLCLLPGFRGAAGQDGDEVAAGSQGRCQEGEETGLLVDQAVQVQADTHGHSILQTTKPTIGQ
jgi:hypothetical protein